MNNSPHTTELQKLLETRKNPKRSDLLAIPSLSRNPLSIIIINKFTNNNIIQFNRMIESLTRLIKSKKLEEKLQFLFDIYDVDSDGLISSLELFELLKILNKGILCNWKLQNIVDKTFAQIGDYKMQMNYEEFKKILIETNFNLKELFLCEE